MCSTPHRWPPRLSRRAPNFSEARVSGVTFWLEVTQSADCIVLVDVCFSFLPASLSPLPPLPPYLPLLRCASYVARRHLQMRVHLHTPTHPRKHSRAYARACSCLRARSRMHAHANGRTYARARAHARVRASIRMSTCTHVQVHTCAQVHALSCAHMHTYVLHSMHTDILVHLHASYLCIHPHAQRMRARNITSANETARAHAREREKATSSPGHLCGFCLQRPICMSTFTTCHSTPVLAAWLDGWLDGCMACWMAGWLSACCLYAHRSVDSLVSSWKRPDVCFNSFHQLDTGGAAATRKPLKNERRKPF